MELDDLPKERLKEMIWQEINILMEKNQGQGMFRSFKPLSAKYADTVYPLYNGVHYNSKLFIMSFCYAQNGFIVQNMYFSQQQIQFKAPKTQIVALAKIIYNLSIFSTSRYLRLN